MSRYKPVGWRNESQRHSLARRGIKTVSKVPSYRVVGAKAKLTDVEKEIVEAKGKEFLVALKKELDGLEISEFAEDGSLGMGIDADFSFTTEGGQEWFGYDDSGRAESQAEDYVREQLEEEPELFTQSWLQSYIDEDNLRDQLESDVSESNYSYFSDIEDESDDEYQNRLVAELVRGGQLDEEIVKDDEGNLKEITTEIQETIDEQKEKAIEEKTEDDIKDPMEYLRNIYGDDDVMKEAIRIAGIDTYEASQDAVDTDGVAHFLSGYDGNEVELETGHVMYRHN